jgi:hypothetical protein
MPKKPPNPELRELATERLRRLHEPDPDQLAREIAEADARGDKLIVVGDLQTIHKCQSDTGDEE